MNDFLAEFSDWNVYVPMTAIVLHRTDIIWVERSTISSFHLANFELVDLCVEITQTYPHFYYISSAGVTSFKYADNTYIHYNYLKYKISKIEF